MDSARGGDRSSGGISFTSALSEGFRLADIAFVAVAPVVMALVFLLPLEIKQGFAFRHADPTMLSAFAANYVHFDLTHLLTNVASYLLVVAVVYVLSLLNGSRLRFYTVLGAILVGFPIPLSALTAAFPLFERIVGFSGIMMAIVGFGLVELSIYLRTHSPGTIGGSVTPGFYFGAATFVAGVYGESVLGSVVFTASAALTIAYWGVYLSSVGAVGRLADSRVAQAGYFEVLLVATTLLTVVVLVAFPRDPVTDYGVVNVYLHLVGFGLGFITPYIWVLLTGIETDAAAV